MSTNEVDSAPYTSPETDVINPQGIEEYNSSGMASISGRIDHLRYIAYLFAMYFLISIIIATIAIPAYQDYVDGTKESQEQAK